MWFQLYRAMKDYHQQRELVEVLSYESAQYDSPPPPESMFRRLDLLKSQLAGMQRPFPN
jgi:hypothetical protein